MKSNIFAKIVAFILGRRDEDHYYPFQDPHNLYSMRRNVLMYLRNLLSIVLEAALLLTATWLLSTFLLYAAFALWKLYNQTPMGTEFALSFPERVATINEIFSYQASHLAAKVTLSAFVLCMALAAVGQVLHVNRCLFYSRNVLERLLFWGPGLTALVSYYLYYTEYAFSSWEIIAVVAAIPTFCLFSKCYDYAGQLFPEIGDLLQFLGEQLKKLRQRIAATKE
ncbi:MAG: hypothetical protein OEL83_13505 [Desulforhopalus sp.]|nr:hypothetical protein [Desulforhopalus sp.]